MGADAGGDKTIEHLGEEGRVVAPPSDFSARAQIGSMDQYAKLYERSIERNEDFWAERANGDAF